MEKDTSDRGTILDALGNLTHGVYVLGSRRGREMTAMSAAWVTRVAERPPCIAVAVREDRYTHDVILDSSIFSLSVLREDQVDVATHFAETSGEYHDKLRGLPFGKTPAGSPYLLDSLGYLDCHLLTSARAGDHTVFIGEITAGDTLDFDRPLIYEPQEYEEALY